MPTFCRHNRFVQNCPICREPEPSRSRPSAPSRPRSGGTSTARRSSARAGGLRVRRVARAADDGFASPLVPGLRAGADAESLAEEIAFATGRLAQLAAAPPGPYAEAASEPDRDEALWLVTLVSLLSPLAGDEPFANFRAARVPWATGEVPALEGVEIGPRSPLRSAAEAPRALAAYRGWAERAGGQEPALTGEQAWTAQRRFDRTFERLGSLPGFGRPARYELLVALGRLGLLDATPAALHFDERDDASMAAKRVFGIGDRINLERRAGDLAEAAAVPVEALDLALANFGRSPDAPRATFGADARAADDETRDRVVAALGL